jgi:hypothetical protein
MAAIAAFTVLLSATPPAAVDITDLIPERFGSPAVIHPHPFEPPSPTESKRRYIRVV